MAEFLLGAKSGTEKSEKFLSRLEVCRAMNLMNSPCEIVLLLKDLRCFFKHCFQWISWWCLVSVLTMQFSTVCAAVRGVSLLYCVSISYRQGFLTLWGVRSLHVLYQANAAAGRLCPGVLLRFNTKCLDTGRMLKNTSNWRSQRCNPIISLCDQKTWK